MINILEMGTSDDGISNLENDERNSWFLTLVALKTNDYHHKRQNPGPDTIYITYNEKKRKKSLAVQQPWYVVYYHEGYL